MICDILAHVYSYRLGSRRTAVLFFPSLRLLATDMFSCQSKLLLSEMYCYTPLLFFLKKLFHSFHSHPFFQYPCPSSARIWTTLRHCDVNITSKSHYLLNRWPYFHWFEESRDIDVTMPMRRADPWTCHIMDM